MWLAVAEDLLRHSIIFLRITNHENNVILPALTVEFRITPGPRLRVAFL